MFSAMAEKGKLVQTIGAIRHVAGPLPLMAVWINRKRVTSSGLLVKRTFGPLGDRNESPLWCFAPFGSAPCSGPGSKCWCGPRNWQQRDEAVCRAAVPIGSPSRWNEVLQAHKPGPFFLAAIFGTADLNLTPYIERMNASLYYYKGFPSGNGQRLHRLWFEAMEERP